MHDLRAEVDGTREGLLRSVSTAQRRLENTYLSTEDLRAKADVVYLQETHGTLDYFNAIAVILPGRNLVSTFVPYRSGKALCKEYTSKYRKFYSLWLRRKRQQQHEQ